MCKIAYNSLNVEQIHPKIDDGICLYTPNTCAKFQLVWSMHMQFLQQSVQKEEE